MPTGKTRAPGNDPAGDGDWKEIVKDALTFGVPVITEDGGGAAAVEVTPTGAPAVGRRIDAAFKSYLGKSTRTLRPDTLPELLSRAFTETEVRGHYEYSARRRPLMGSAGAAAGTTVAPELTGAAAVVYSYALSTVTQCKEKLAGFEPLIEVEEEPLDTIRDVANADLDDLVSALATDDIVPERVDLAFAKLGVDASTKSAGVRGDLALVRDR